MILPVSTVECDSLSWFDHRVHGIKLVITWTVLSQYTVTVIIEECTTFTLTASHTCLVTVRSVLDMLTRVLTVRVTFRVSTASGTVQCYSKYE